MFLLRGFSHFIVATCNRIRNTGPTQTFLVPLDDIPMKNAAAQKRRFILLVLGICSLSRVAGTAQTNTAGESPRLDIPREHSRISTDLANTLVFITAEYQVPIVAELAATEDPKVDITAGKATARQLLNSLVAKSPEYVWKEQAGVVHFYNKTILNAPAHPLNFKLKIFQLPENVSQPKIFLPARLHNASQGIQEGSAAISAFPSTELEQQKLPSKIFRDATGRDILLAAASSEPQFSSIIVLANSHPKGEKDLEYAYKHWFWFAMTSQNQPVISMNGQK
jgi:hypothetical protein